MNDPIDGVVAAETATITVPNTVSGVLVVRFTPGRVCCLTVLDRGLTYEVYGLADSLALALAPNMVRKVMSRGARAGQPYWVGRGAVTVDPSLVGTEVTPDEFGAVSISVVDVNPRPLATACGETVAAAFGL